MILSDTMEDTMLPGTKYIGFQRSRGSAYEVEVTILDSKLDQNYMCGYLTIKGLTLDYPILTTFFEGEIIGKGNDFLTRKWQATYETDLKHWSKFKEFEKYKSKFEAGDLDPESTDRSECLFMRWKEKFLVPCHQVSAIPGASFAGFYYICLNRRRPSIHGFYYHQTSEWFQCLELDYVNTRSSGIYQFS